MILFPHFYPKVNCCNPDLTDPQLEKFMDSQNKHKTYDLTEICKITFIKLKLTSSMRIDSCCF